MSEKSLESKPFNKSYKYTPRHNEKSIEHTQYNKTYKYPTKCDVKSYPQQQKDRYVDAYTQRQKINYDNPRQDDKSYYQQKTKSVKQEKQEKPRSVYKYKIERDESGNSRYVLEEPIDNPINLLNNREFVCIYPSSGAKYYKNINIYNYKKKIII
jgi:hypothetical protein